MINPSNSQFLAFMAFDRTIALDPVSIVEALKWNGVGEGSAVESVGGGKDGQPLILMINNIPYSVLQIEQPLPRNAYESAARSQRSWPEAASVLANSRSHLVIGPLRPTHGVHQAALQAAVDLTRLCSALVEIEGARAVLWTTGNVLVEASRFQLAARELAQTRLPVMTWISVVPVVGPKTLRGEQTFAMLTTGLEPFVGREIEFPPSTMKPEDITKRVLVLAHMLVSNGAFVKDGETIDMSMGAPVLVKYQTEGQRPGVPVLSVSPAGPPS